MKTSLRQKLLMIIAAFSMTVPPVAGQVTIGSGIEPVNGAILDLKQEQKDDGTVNSTKGLMLPRVVLTNPTDITTGDIAGVTSANKDAHIGLTVYNLTQCDGKFARGVYTWTGTEWVQLTKNPVLTVDDPTLTFPQTLIDNSYLVRIPSGQDARTAWTSAYAPTITFAGTNQVTGTWATTTTLGTISSGLVFNANPLLPSDLTSTGATWTLSPINDISIWPEAMTTAEVTTNPWMTRESKLTITGIAGIGSGPCPGGTDQSQVITLNQTNYAIVASTSTSESTSGITPATLVVLRNTTAANLPIHSNVEWIATTAATSTQLAKVLSSADLTNATAKGGDKSDGTKYTPLSGSRFDYQSVPVTNAVKYETVDVTFEDANTPKRAPDATVTFFQCQGNEDTSLASGVLDAGQTAYQDPASWGTSVVRHPAKAVDPMDATQGNIYEEFYSAWFGDPASGGAGRWMTTNLTAWKYDGITHSAGRTLTGPTADYGYNVAYWCYPGASFQTSQPSTWYSQQGLLYTWDAATAGKGGDTGQKNIYSMSAASTAANNEGGWPYHPDQLNGTWTIFPGNSNMGNYQWRVQGICPQGWHLPSDREWTELENVIIQNTSSYAYAPDISPDGDALLDLNGTRGSANYSELPRGLAMKEQCGLNNIDPHGYSKRLADGGFNALLVGFRYSGNFGAWGGRTYFWTSSEMNSQRAYMRGLWENRDYVSVPGTMNSESTTYGSSVRCRKD